MEPVEGYDRDYFLHEVDQNLICAICKNVLREPRTCKEGHTFCSVCISSWLDAGKNNRCPIDCNSLWKEDLTGVNLALCGIINGLAVRCPHNKLILRESHSKDELEEQDNEGSAPSVSNNNKKTKKKRGPNAGNRTVRFATSNSMDGTSCTWTGRLERLQKHLTECDYETVSCENEECSAKFTRKESKLHAEVCEYRVVPCPHCTKQEKYHALEQHYAECPFVAIPCINGCCQDEAESEITMILRKDMEDHVKNECELSTIDCPFKIDGCKVSMLRKELDDHLEVYVQNHLMLLSMMSRGLRTKIAELEAMNAKLETKNASLLNRVAQLENTKQKPDFTVVGQYFWRIETLSPEKGAKSPIFEIGGFTWRISLKKTQEGRYGLFLKQVNGISCDVAYSFQLHAFDKQVCKCHKSAGPYTQHFGNPDWKWGCASNDLISRQDLNPEWQISVCVNIRISNN